MIIIHLMYENLNRKEEKKFFKKHKYVHRWKQMFLVRNENAADHSG